MAEEQEDTATEKSGKSGGIAKLLLISLVVSLVMSSAVGGAVYFLLQDRPPANAAEEGPEEVESEPAGPPIYHELEDSFIVNLSEQPGRFLQVSVELMTRKEEVVNAIDTHKPIIRNNLLILFSSQTLEDISTREGKESLRAAARDEVKAILEERGEPDEVEEVFFTSLVVQ